MSSATITRVLAYQIRAQYLDVLRFPEEYTQEERAEAFSYVRALANRRCETFAQTRADLLNEPSTLN